MVQKKNNIKMQTPPLQQPPLRMKKGQFSSEFKKIEQVIKHS